MLKGYPNAPVILKGWEGQGFNMFPSAADSRKASVRFEGDCETWFYIANSWCVLNATNIVFNHSGDTRIAFAKASSGTAAAQMAGGYVRTLAANILPWGPGTGNVVVETRTDALTQKNLDFHGYPQMLNGLAVRGEACLVNTNGDVTLTFGTGDTDGILSGPITNETIFCEKTGTGTLSLESADVYSLVATNGGTIAIAAGSNHVHSLKIDNAAISFASNATLTADSVQIGDNVHVLLDASATNVVHMAFPLVSGNRRYVKEGASYATYATPADAQGADLAVNGGTLRFGGAECTNAWWRFTVKKAKVDFWHATSKELPESVFYRDITLGLGSIGMFAPDGQYSYKSFSNADNGTAASSLAEGQATSARPWMKWSLSIMQSLYPEPDYHVTAEPIMSGGSCIYGAHAFVTQDASYFNGNHYDIPANSSTCKISYWGSGLIYTNRVIRADDPDTWETVTWRTKGEWGRSAASYSLRRFVNRNERSTFPHPSDWVLESSADGVTWEKMDERTNQTFALYTEYPYLSTQFNFMYNAHVPYIFSAKNADWKFKTFGTVEVAPGAVLDLSEIPMTNIAFNAIAVDCAGAGRITRFRPAESGTIYVTSSAATRIGEGRIATTVTLPLVLDETGDMANISSWNVVVDGNLSRASMASFENGRIVIHTNIGTMMILR